MLNLHHFTGADPLGPGPRSKALPHQSQSPMGSSRQDLENDGEVHGVDTDLLNDVGFYKYGSNESVCFDSFCLVDSCS